MPRAAILTRFNLLKQKSLDDRVFRQVGIRIGHRLS